MLNKGSTDTNKKK